MTLPQQATDLLSVQLTVTLAGDVLQLGGGGGSGELVVDFVAGESQVRDVEVFTYRTLRRHLALNESHSVAVV